MHLNLQTFTATITIKCCGKLETTVSSEDHHILLEKRVRSWLRCSLCPGRKSVLLHTQEAGPGLGAQTAPRDRARGAVCSRWGLVWALRRVRPWLMSHLSLMVAPARLQKGELPFWREAISSAHEVNCLLWAVCQSAGMVYPSFRKCLFHY